MENDLLEKVKVRVVYFDGAMGTMLMNAGLTRGETPESWNLEKPSKVMAIHEKYYAAGSDVVHTNTFGGSALKLAEKGLGDKMEILNREAAAIAKAVCPTGKFVAGDIGPIGKMLKPLGELTPDAAEKAFTEQAAALLDGGADFISIETMFSLEEALIAVKGAKRAGAGIISAAVTYNKTPKGFFTLMGEGVEKCCSGLEAAGANIIASNCTLGSREMIDLTRAMRKATDRPILIQPNAGKPLVLKGLTHYEQTASEFARDGQAIIDAGADMIGGCCGTDDEFIRVVVNVLEKKKA